MKAFILAAGQGTRLVPLTINRPKPMLPVLNKPVLEHILDWLCRQGIEEFIINLYHKPECIKKYFKARNKFKITYSQEPVLLGTAGAVKRRQSLLKETFLVVYGDNFFKTDLEKFFEFHKKTKANISVGLSEAEDTEGKGVVALDKNGKVIKFKEKPQQKQEAFSHLVNAGIYLVEPDILRHMPKNTFYDFGKDVFPQFTDTKKLSGLYGFKLEGILEDVGTLENFLDINLKLLGKEDNLLGSNCRLGKADISHCVIGNRCIIKDNALLKNCLLDEGVEVEEGAYIKDSIILKGSSIGKEADITQASIAENCLVGQGACLASGVRLWPNAKVGKYMKVITDVKN